MIGLKHCNDPRAFIEYSNDMDITYENIDKSNPNKKCEILIIQDDMITNMMCLVTKKFKRE